MSIDDEPKPDSAEPESAQLKTAQPKTAQMKTAQPKSDVAGPRTARRLLWPAIGLVVAIGLVGSVAYTLGRSAGESTSGGTSQDKALIPGTADKVRTGEPKDVDLRTTGYSYQDNTPRNSDKISGSTIHQVAGGVGTYEDPITVAVPGHGGNGAQLPIGTRIYYKDFQFYGIVEDTGATKFSGSTHTDIWVDGRGFSADQAEKCMDPVTKKSVAAILNPPAGLPVRAPGPITNGDKCNVGGS